MRKMLVGLVVLWSVAAIANAAQIAGRDVGITVDTTYTSKYLWRGFDKLDDVSAWQPSVNFDLGGGFSANVFASYAGSGGTTVDGLSRVNLTEYQYTLAYSGIVNEGSPCRTDYSIGYRYYDYIDTDTQDNDLQEVFATAAMPEIIGGGIVPHAAVFQMWQAHSDAQGLAHNWNGTIYLIGFNYNINAEQVAGMDTGNLPIIFGWDIVYNDGTGPFNVDQDWSHMVWSLKTSAKCPLTGAKITPAVYFQNSFEDSINPEDELWASLSYAFSF